MYRSVSVIFVLFFVQGAFSQLDFNGECPKVKLLETFDISAFLGIWYGIYKYPVVKTQERPVISGSKCIYSDFANVGNKLLIDAYGIDSNTGVNTSISWEGTIVGPGQFSFEGAPQQSLNSSTVVATDYTNYATLFDCVPLNDSKYRVVAFIVSRERTLNDDIFTLAKKPLTDVNLNVDLLVPYDQTDCPAV